jgi:predicted ABC-type transport system involved in lysophospholipase L1 biosynthesis ATPase subunit
VDELIHTVGLGEQAGQKIASLSGGQRRRLDVAIGIVGRPELLFLDEPTAGFDPMRGGTSTIWCIACRTSTWALVGLVLAPVVLRRMARRSPAPTWRLAGSGRSSASADMMSCDE